MNIFISFILAIVSSMLIDNVVLSRFYGICPFLGVSKKVNSSLGMGLAVVFVIVLATVICWPLFNYVLVPAGIPFMDTVAYILVIASLVQLVGLFIKKFSPSLYKSLIPSSSYNLYSLIGFVVFLTFGTTAFFKPLLPT